MISVSCRKISDANRIRKQDKRQFYGGFNFDRISIWPFFSYVWGGHHNRWYSLKSYGYGWGAPWYLFGPRFLIGRRFWKKRWESWSGFHDVWFG
ncbi:putative integral membrane protein [Acanthocheilonema viteae]